MKKFKKRYFFLIIILIFGIWNLSWYAITTIKYNKYVEAIPKNKWGLHFIEKDDGYTYSVKKPDYLSFTGNLAVANNEKQEMLIIWPLVTGGYEYGFRLQKDGLAYEIYVDENLKPINKDATNQVSIQKVEEYKDELEALRAKADKMWELN